MQKTKSGFTIVELLIVIVVIAILATITVVAYNGIQQRARASAAASALNQAAKKLAIYSLENSTYPPNLAAANITNMSDVSYQYSITATGYCVTATSGTVSYKISESTSATQGGCAGHGQGGVAAISNLIPNPSVEANTTGWSYRWYGNVGGAGTNSRPTTGGLYGSAYLRKTWTVGGAAADTGFNTSAGQIAVTAGNTYMFSGSLRTNRSDVATRVGVQWYDSTGTQIGAAATWGSSTTLTANTWRRFSQSFTAPAGAVTAIAIFSSSNSSAWAVNDTYDFDGGMVSDTSANYADGNTTDWAWSGTPNNSVSSGPPQ
jgi:prepilin-type N-terminal cleavage/methylation domain-containing protein